MAEVKLRIEDLEKSYGDEVAVDKLSTEVKSGQLKSLLGPSGCGKTTTLRCVAGLEKPDSGRIYIDGELVSAPDEGVHLSADNRGIGMVFQSYAIWPHMTVEQNVRFPLKMQKIGDKSQQMERVTEVLNRVGLDEYSSNLATNLSGGQQQRVAIARALVTEPEVLLFDEPLSNLDAKLRRDMRLEIKELYQEFGTTILYVTHSQDEAMFLSKEIAVMLDGTIIEEGDPVDLHDNPKSFFGMNFMGHCNTLQGKVTSRDADRVVVETSIGVFELPGRTAGRVESEDVYLCFRPKHCSIATNDDGGGYGLVLDGELAMTSATRDFIEYQVDIGDARILVRTTEPTDVEPGDGVQLSIALDDVKMFSYDEGRPSITERQVDTVQAR